MKSGAALLVFSTAVAVIYGVAFSYTYPLVEISTGIVTLFAVAGLLTCLAAAGIWNAVTNRKSHQSLEDAHRGQQGPARADDA